MAVQTSSSVQPILPQLKMLYPNQWEQVADMIQSYLNDNKEPQPEPRPLNQQDIMLITYADSVQSHGEMPLTTLRTFYRQFGQSAFSSVHILPFFPWTSDDGFAVVNYHAVDPAVGDWDLVDALAEETELMLDAVINHMSSSSFWFQKYLAEDPEYKNYFIEADPALDYSAVTRPRNLPLLTPFMTESGEKHLWTTFSDDQIDLNMAEPKVLLAVIDVLYRYAMEGGRFIRLDAVGFVWKKLGTTCMHLPETHAVIQILRWVLDQLKPGTYIITETNVPHEQNISYFGNGYNEASLVYQFPLPPLVLHTLLTGNSHKLTEWAKSLTTPSNETTFLNFLASHDGIGVRPATGILSDQEIKQLMDHTHAQGGYVSFKDNGDGTESPYELNISYFDAISRADLPASVNRQRMVAAHGILYALQGMPAVYIHSFLGSHGDREGAEKSGIKRRINRRKLDFETLDTELLDTTHERSLVSSALTQLSQVRSDEPLLSPFSGQRLHHWNNQLVVIERFGESGHLWCIINVGESSLDIRSLVTSQVGTAMDLLSKRTSNDIQSIQPYEILWLKSVNE